MERRRTILAKNGSWAERARRLKVELFALYLAARHPQTPWYAKVVVAGFVAYAITPVDFFPDVLPVLGLVDDLIFVPLALAVAIKFVPSAVLAECRGRAQERIAVSRKFNWVLLFGVWTALAIAGIALTL
jgi:uncharacterized membrane protein YkvA (DUF1232 family)